MRKYEAVQAEVKRTAGFTPETCWIAHVLSDHGLTTRKAPHRIDPTKRVKPCPPDRRPAIIAALRAL
jgi:hypothetical protein